MGLIIFSWSPISKGSSVGNFTNKFSLSSSDGELLPVVNVNNVSNGDAGGYICRVDSTTYPTQYTNITLKILGK